MKSLKDQQQELMKMLKFAIFVKKSLRIYILKIKNVKLEIIVIIKLNTAHSIRNLKYSVLKKICIVFHIGANFDYHFIIKELPEEFEGKFNCLGKNTEKYITFPIPIEKEVKRIDKSLLDYNLLTVQDLWPLHYQILSIIFSERSQKLSVQTVTSAVLNTQTLKMVLIEFKCLCCNKNYQKKFDEN